MCTVEAYREICVRREASPFPPFLSLIEASPFTPLLSLMNILPVCFDSAQVLYMTYSNV